MTIDTNIIIAYLAGEKRIIDLLTSWRLRGGFLYLPAVVEAEVLAFSKFTEIEYTLTQKFLEENFIFINLDRTIIRIAAEIRKNNKIKLPDALIAATAMHTKSPLITKNHRDFKKIKGLRLVDINQ